MEKTLTPEESLQIIQKSILQSRKNLRDGSFYFLLWGWVLIVAAFTHFAVVLYHIKFKVNYGGWWKSVAIWTFFVAVAFIWQQIKISKENRKVMVKTREDRMISIIWTGAGIGMGLIVFFCIKVQTIPVPFILAITAMSTFMTGMMIKFRPLVVGGLVFAVSSVIAIYLNGVGMLLICAISLILGYLVPGYMLRAIKDEENV